MTKMIFASRWTASLMLAATLLAGCGTYDVPEPGPMHPANPDASQAEFAQLSDVLAIDESDLPTMPAEMHMGRNHGGQHMMGNMSGRGGEEGEMSR